jgi:hypothetical protein
MISTPHLELPDAMKLDIQSASPLAIQEHLEECGLAVFQCDDVAFLDALAPKLGKVFRHPHSNEAGVTRLIVDNNSASKDRRGFTYSSLFPHTEPPR